jgi:NAD+ kinase
MIQTVGIVCKPRKEEICAVIPSLLAWLRARHLQVHLDTETAECCQPPEPSLTRDELARRVDLLIVLGGDGTILATARHLHDREIPILPVNLGGLGFLTSVTLDELYPLIEQVLAGKHQISPRIMLEAEVRRDGSVAERQKALNDAVVTQAALARMMDFDVYVNQSQVGRYRADGLIVSTPTGSTAYSLAAGGPIIYPDLDAFVITPICPHMLTNRPLVIPAAATVEIDFPAEETLTLTLDGQIGIRLGQSDRVTVRKSPARVLLVRPPNKTYFEVLRNKLRWGER